MNVISNAIRGRPVTGAPGGFKIVYHDGEPNRCPGCGRRHWFVGRVTAECAFCETALPLDSVHGIGFAPRFTTGHEVDDLPLKLRPLA